MRTLALDAPAVQAHIRKLTKIIRDLDARRGTSVEWEIKKYETVLS